MTTTDYQILAQRLTHIARQLKPQYEVDTRIVFKNERTDEYALVSIRNKELDFNHELIYFETFTEGKGDVIAFCDEIFSFCFMQNMFKRPIDLIIVN
jgi:hypothetical protein